VALAGGFATKSTELLKVAKFTPGTVANFDDVMQRRRPHQEAPEPPGLYARGTTIERALNDKTKVVNVTIRITEGPQFNFGRLTIEGLDLNAEAAMKKLWAEGR